MPTLHNLDVEWVSLVDRAAVRDPQNQDQPMRFLVWKRDTEGAHMTAEETQAALDKAQEDLKKAQAERDAEKARAEKAETERDDALAKATDPEDQKKNEDDQIDKSDLPPAVRAALEKAETDRATERERAEKAEKDAAEAKQIAKAEQDARLTREYVAKAEKLDALAVKADDFGPVLKEAAEKLSKESYDAIETVLKAADEAVRKGDLFTEMGRGREGAASTALAEAQQKAAELKKSDPNLTDAQALDKALTGDRALQERYLAEVR